MLHGHIRLRTRSSIGILNEEIDLFLQFLLFQNSFLENHIFRV